MRPRTCYARFFKDSLNKRAVTPILELDEAIAYTLAQEGGRKTMTMVMTIMMMMMMIMMMMTIMIIMCFLHPKGLAPGGANKL